MRVVIIFIATRLLSSLVIQMRKVPLPSIQTPFLSQTLTSLYEALKLVTPSKVSPIIHVAPVSLIQQSKYSVLFVFL